MPALGEYADSLRAVGLLLDEARGAAIAVREDNTTLHLTWRGSVGEYEALRLHAEDLTALRTRARAMRTQADAATRFARAEQLRTLGCMVDQLGSEAMAWDRAGAETALDTVRIDERPGGYHLVVRLSGVPIAQAVSYGVVAARSRIYQRRRRPTPPER
jgi:hypothetical protein